jgi:hypothetical protein
MAAEKIKVVKLDGGVAIILWQKDDKKYFTIEKQYKDKASGEWKKSNYYFLEQVAAIRDTLNTQFPLLDEIEVPKPEEDDSPF